jgi:hypothetical protein
VKLIIEIVKNGNKLTFKPSFLSQLFKVLWKKVKLFCVKVILKIDNTTSVVVSAAISVGYTLIGGMISVAYTDVFQLFFIGFGLVSKPGTTLALKNQPKMTKLVTNSLSLPFYKKKIACDLNQVVHRLRILSKLVFIQPT